MKTSALFRVLLLLLLLLPAVALPSCATASSTIAPVDQEWRDITNAGIPGIDDATAEKLNHFGETVAQAVADATFFGSRAVASPPLHGASPPTAPAPSVPALAAAVTTGALTGNWPGVVNTLISAVIAGGATVYGYRKVNADRDKTSLERTTIEVAQLRSLREPVPLPAAQPA